MELSPQAAPDSGLMSAAPDCSVVIPSYNGRHLLATCLASIARHRPASPSIEVIVADDASTDGTAAWLAEVYPDVILVRLERNSGFCAAANAGIAAARGRIVQLLNNDTEVEANWIAAGLEPFADPAVGSVAPLVLVRSDPARVDSAGDQYALVGWPSKRGHGQMAHQWTDRPADRVFGASGSSAFYRAAALAQVSGFDPTYGSYYEDVDLAFRLRWAGYDCVFAPNCRILHDLSASYDHTSPRLQERMARNAEILFWSNLPRGWLGLAALPHLGFTLIQFFHRAMRGRHLPFVRGKVAAIRDWSAIAPRRRLRADLALTAPRPPRFPIRVGIWEDLANHLRRPPGRGG